MGVFYFYGVFIYKTIKMAKTIKKSDLDKMYKIKKLIEYYCDVDVSKVNRSRKFTAPRAVFIRLCLEETDLTLEQLAFRLNVKHPSIIHSNKVIFPELEQSNSEYYKIYVKIKSGIADKEMDCSDDKTDLMRTIMKLSDRQILEVCQLLQPKFDEYGL
jgi:hypothetical protein